MYYTKSNCVTFYLDLYSKCFLAAILAEIDPVFWRRIDVYISSMFDIINSRFKIVFYWALNSMIKYSDKQNFSTLFMWIFYELTAFNWGRPLGGNVLFIRIFYHVIWSSIKHKMNWCITLACWWKPLESYH